MKTNEIVKLLGVASCCTVMAVSAAKADAVALSDSDLDRVTAAQLAPPPPLLELPPAFQGQFDTLPGLFDPPPPPPPPPPAPETPTVPLPDVRGLPGEFLGAILQLILGGGLR